MNDINSLRVSYLKAVEYMRSRSIRGNDTKVLGKLWKVVWKRQRELINALSMLDEVPITVRYEDGESWMKVDTTDSPKLFVPKELWKAYEYHRAESRCWSRWITYFEHITYVEKEDR